MLTLLKVPKCYYGCSKHWCFRRGNQLWYIVIVSLIAFCKTHACSPPPRYRSPSTIRIVGIRYTHVLAHAFHVLHMQIHLCSLRRHHHRSKQEWVAHWRFTCSGAYIRSSKHCLLWHRSRSSPLLRDTWWIQTLPRCLDSVCMLKLCASSSHQTLTSLYLILKVIFDVFAFAMLVINALSRPRHESERLLRMLYSDGVVFFLVCVRYRFRLISITDGMNLLDYLQ